MTVSPFSSGIRACQVPNSPAATSTSGGGAMILGGIVAIFFGVNGEGKSLEDVAKPLSVIAKPAETIFRPGIPPEGLVGSAGD